MILILAAPLVLTLGLGLVTGSMSNSGDSGIKNIQLITVNHDNAQLDDALVTVFLLDDV